MPQSRFQFTLRDLIWFTFWTALSLAAWAIIWRYESPETLAVLVAFAGLIAPLMAVGTLLRRNTESLLFMLTVIGLCYVLLAMLLGVGWLK